MRLGIMQPYFFPYLGHFALIANVDRWIVFDVTQYTPKSWMNRNRVLHPKEGWQYISAPIANSSISLRTDQAMLADKKALLSSTLGKLSHYRPNAPYYRHVVKLVEDAFSQAGDDLVALNVSGLARVCEYLEIPFRYDICSRLALPLPDDLGPGDWAPTISALLGAKEYLNPAGGRALFDPQIFRQKGISLGFLDFQAYAYPVRNYAFEPGLSILDVLMWNSPEQVNDAIRANSRIERA
jgi:hypothetical protein